MASSVVRAGQLFVRRNCANLYLRPSVSSSANNRFISTSKKNEETATAAEKIPSAIDSVAAKAARKEKFMSYGFSNTDRYEDVATTHIMMFMTITFTMTIGFVIFTYGPEKKMRDWAQREAYLTIRYREANGLPLIDANYVDPSKMELPSEEALGDAEIII